MRKSSIFWGVLFLIIGILIWLGNLNVLAIDFSRDWPIIFIIVGIIILIKGIRFRKSSNKKSVKTTLDDLEKGKIDAKQAVDSIKKGDKK
jgi:uncharacterized membrane protein